MRLPSHSDYEEELINSALAMLARAVAIDPRFSSAYGLMANCHVHRLNRGWGSVADVTKRGLEAAKLAAETGRDDPRALGLAANGIARFGGNIEEALVHIERALALSPRLRPREAIEWLDVLCRRRTRAVHRTFQARDAARSDGSLGIRYYLGIAFPYFFTGRYEEALVWVDKALVERPNYAVALRLQIAALAMAGRPFGEIQEAIGRLHMVEPELSITESCSDLRISGKSTLSSMRRRCASQVCRNDPVRSGCPSTARADNRVLRGSAGECPGFFVLLGGGTGSPAEAQGTRLPVTH